MKEGGERGRVGVRAGGAAARGAVSACAFALAFAQSQAHARARAAPRPWATPATHFAALGFPTRNV